MKQLSFLLAAFTAVFLLSTSIAFSNGDPGDNSFKLKTEVLGDHKADIMVFAWNEDSNKWVKALDKDDKKKLSLLLNPEVNYQVWFTSETGVIKILYIDAGESGYWYEEFAVDFDNLRQKYARYYQKNRNYGYAMEYVGRHYKPRQLMASTY